MHACACTIQPKIFAEKNFGQASYNVPTYMYMYMYC